MAQVFELVVDKRERHISSTTPWCWVVPVEVPSGFIFPRLGVVVFLPLREFMIQLSNFQMDMFPLPHFLFRHESTCFLILNYRLGLTLIPL